jgi:hypothetical protein
MAWVAILYPPPFIREFFFASFSLVTGVFSGCKLSLLKQHIFLILIQLSWDGYLLLLQLKVSIRGTLPRCTAGVA